MLETRFLVGNPIPEWLPLWHSSRLIADPVPRLHDVARFSSVSYQNLIPVPVRWNGVFFKALQCYEFALNFWLYP